MEDQCDIPILKGNQLIFVLTRLFLRFLNSSSTFHIATNDSPWKEIQIGSLKTLQTADLQRRRTIYPKTNEMFLAYKVEPVPSSSFDKPLILDLDKVQNLQQPEEGKEYVRGEIIGFVEITQKPYGLGQGKGRAVYDDEPLPPLRPILTNLAVKKSVRKYGVGSKLLDACEEHVQNTWEMGEIVLEVEDFNTGALDFYSNREFDTLYDDPASRRYDVGGFVLRKVRCTRKVMRKEFEGSESDSESEGEDEAVTIDADFFNRKKSSVS